MEHHKDYLCNKQWIRCLYWWWSKSIQNCWLGNTGFHSKITTNLGSISSGSTSSSAFFGGNAVAPAYATHHNLTGNVYIYVWIYGSQSNTDSVFRGFSW